jgi:hypothetical protein
VSSRDMPLVGGSPITHINKINQRSTELRFYTKARDVKNNSTLRNANDNSLFQARI